MYKIKDKIAAYKWDLHIYDESHYIKNPDSKRAMAILGHEIPSRRSYTLEARCKLFLTGTPILNRPVELWSMLRVIDPTGLGTNFWLFAKQFCGVEGDAGERDFSGASNLNILQDRLRSGIMVRRLKSEVMRELPPKRRQIIPIPLPPQAEKVVQKELEFYTSNQDVIEKAVELQAAAQVTGDKESFIAASKLLRGAKQASFEELAKLRHDTARAMVPFAISYLREALEEQEKIVVFGWHEDVVTGIAAPFGNSAFVMHGGITVPQRQEMVDRFDRDPACKLAVGTIGTMGVGWTLVRSSYVIFFERSWVPSQLNQAEDRLHRIGQRDAVLVHHVCFDKSVDVNMLKKVIAKQEVIDKSLDIPS